MESMQGKHRPLHSTTSFKEDSQPNQIRVECVVLGLGVLYHKVVHICTISRRSVGWSQKR